MADSISGKFDLSGWKVGLDQLGGKARESLARSMAVAGGQVLRDEAIARVPVGTAEGGSFRPGLLKSALYLAYKPARSTGGEFVYSVSWNAKKAPHGHLVEFGHWQIYATYKGADGYWYSNPKKRLDQPKWIHAQPFLRPALDAASGRAYQAMIKRGRERLFDLLADPDDTGDA